MIRAKAIEFSERYFKLAEVMGDASAKMNYYSFMAAVHGEQGDYTKALEYNEEALELAETLKDTSAITMQMGNLASTHRGRGDLVQARQLFDKAITLARRGGGFIYGPLLFRAGLFMELKDYDAAERDILELLEINEGNSQLHMALVDVHEARGNIDMAISEARRAYDLDSSNFPEGTLRAAGKLAELYRRQHRYPEALEMMAVQLQWRDSVDNIANVKALERAEYERKLLADSLVNHEAIVRTELAHHAEVAREKNRRNIFLFSGIGVLLVAGGCGTACGIHAVRGRKPMYCAFVPSTANGPSTSSWPT